MTVPTQLIVLAGLLLVALILWLLVPSGVFTFSVGATAGGMGVLGKSDLAQRQKLLTVIMVSAAKHRIATPAELQAAFDLLPP